MNKILAFTAPVLPLAGQAAANATDIPWLGTAGELSMTGILLYFLYILWKALTNLQKAQTKSIAELTAVCSRNNLVIEQCTEAIRSCKKVQRMTAGECICDKCMNEHRHNT